MVFASSREQIVAATGVVLRFSLDRALSPTYRKRIIMQTLRQIVTSTAPTGARICLTAAILCASSSVGLAGLIGPGGGAHTWTGGLTSSWQDTANWNTGIVPGAADAAIIDDGPFNNIYLNADSADLGSLYIAGTKTVSTNGFLLDVTNSGGETTITGLDSRIFVASNGGATAFRTDDLSILGTSRLQMSGGIARIYDQFTMSNNSRIVGHGLIEVNSANPAAFNTINGDQISAVGGDLTLRVIGGGGFTMAHEINVLDDNSSLSIEGPFFLDSFDDVNFGANTLMNVDSDWNLAGTLNADPGAGNTATVTGGAIHVEGNLDVDSGTLVIEAPVALDSVSSIAVGTDDTLELNSSHNVNNGQISSVSLNGTLRINGTQELFGWNGDVVLNAGTLEVNEPQNVSWIINGDITLGSFFGIRSHLAGDATMRATGNIFLPGNGGIVDNDFDLRSGATMDIALPTTSLTVNGSFNQRTGAHIFGDGIIEISDSGSMIVHEPVNLDVSVVNAGLFEVVGDGEEPGYVYINGGYTQEATGEIAVQIAGPSSMEHDVYETNFATSLAGTVTVELLDGYLPNIGDTFDVFFGNGGVVGSFDTIAGEPGFEVSVVGNTVTLTYIGLGSCPTDLNNDGVTDTADLGLLIAAFGTMNPGVDINNDGIVDTADLGLLISEFGMACL